MKILEITKENFEREVMQASKPVLIDFWAPWCGPCRMMAPILEEAAESIGEQALIGKVNVDEQAELANQFEIMSIPTLVIIKQGKIANTLVGVQTKEKVISELLH